MERSQECESLIHVPPLLFNERLFVLTHTASFKPVFLSVQDGYIIDINFMFTRNYVFEDC